MSSCENEDLYIKKALEEKEKGDYDNAIYYLDDASLIAFSKRDLEKVKEIENIVSELKEKTEYSSAPFTDFFVKITNLMLKNEKLPNDVIDEFFGVVVECIEEIKEDIKYAVSALKIIVDYMKSKNQEVPSWIYEWIKDKEEFINEMERIKKGSNVIIMSKNFKKGTVMGNFIGGMLNKSKMKIVKKHSMEFGIIEVDGAVVEVPLKAMNFTGGIFMANGVRDEEHLKKIIKVIDDLIEKNIVLYDRGRC